MVKLTTKYLIKRNKWNKYFLTRKKGDTDEEFLKRITHLPLQNNFIEQILKMENCVNVKALYLQHNLLTNLENLQNFPNLTHLYLQRNFITKLDNLNCLKKLKKIYLGHNEIQVLEGMEGLEVIKEIHVENQDLCLGDTMYFDPLTVRSLGKTLECLNISCNYLTSIRGLEHLKSIKILNASQNYLADVEDVTATISGWNSLQQLNLTGNPLTKIKRYEDAIIVAAINLEILNDSPIHPNTRIFVENLAEMKKLREIKMKAKESETANETANREVGKTLKFADDADSKETLFSFSDSFPAAKHPAFLHPPWKLRVNVNPTNPTKSLPRAYWRKGGAVHERKTHVSWNLPPFN